MSFIEKVSPVDSKELTCQSMADVVNSGATMKILALVMQHSGIDFSYLDNSLQYLEKGIFLQSWVDKFEILFEEEEELILKYLRVVLRNLTNKKPSEKLGKDENDVDDVEGEPKEAFLEELFYEVEYSGILGKKRSNSISLENFKDAFFELINKCTIIPTYKNIVSRIDKLDVYEVESDKGRGWIRVNKQTGAFEELIPPIYACLQFDGMRNIKVYLQETRCYGLYSFSGGKLIKSLVDKYRDIDIVDQKTVFVIDRYGYKKMIGIQEDGTLKPILNGYDEIRKTSHKGIFMYRSGKQYHVIEIDDTFNVHHLCEPVYSQIVEDKDKGFYIIGLLGSKWIYKYKH